MVVELWKQSRYCYEEIGEQSVLDSCVTVFTHSYICFCWYRLGLCSPFELRKCYFYGKEYEKSSMCRDGCLLAGPLGQLARQGD